MSWKSLEEKKRSKEIADKVSGVVEDYQKQYFAENHIRISVRELERRMDMTHPMLDNIMKNKNNLLDDRSRWSLIKIGEYFGTYFDEEELKPYIDTSKARARETKSEKPPLPEAKEESKDKLGITRSDVKGVADVQVIGRPVVRALVKEQNEGLGITIRTASVITFIKAMANERGESIDNIGETLMLRGMRIFQQQAQIDKLRKPKKPPKSKRK